MLLFSDRFWGRTFLFISLFSGASLLGEVIFGAWSWPWLLALAFGLWWSCGVLSASAFYDMDREISPDHAQAVPRWDFWIAGFFGVLALAHASLYVYETAGSIWIRNMNLNGDLPFHWHMVEYLSRAPDFWPGNNIFGLDRLRYAFGVNYLSALMHRHGLPIEAALVFPLILSLVAVFQQLWKWAGLWAVVAFFASGGGWWLPVGTWSQIWGPGDQLAWKNLFLSILVTQRGFWFALPAGIFWIRFLTEMQKNPWLATPEKWRFIFAIWAFMPFFHLHSFVILTIFGVISSLMSPLRQDFRSILKQSLTWAWIPLVFILSSISFRNANASVRLVTNWMSETAPWNVAWGVNFGPLPFLVLFLGLAYITRLKFRGRRVVDDHQDTKVFATWVLLGLIFSHVMLAPWNWDQTKILLWVYLGVSVAIGRVMTQLLPRSVAIVLLLLLHLPGLAQLRGGVGHQMGKHALWTVEDQTAVANLMRDIPIDEKVLVAPSPHHPIFSTGQPIVAGYMGHLWSQGLPINGLEDFLKAWMRDPSDPLLREGPFHELKSQYLLWGPLEREWAGTATPGGESDGGSKWQQIAVSGNWVLYKSAQYR